MCVFTWCHITNVSDSTTYHRQLSPLPKHTQRNRWWGFFLELLTPINYNIYIMQTGSKPGMWHLHVKNEIYRVVFFVTRQSEQEMHFWWAWPYNRSIIDGWFFWVSQDKYVNFIFAYFYFYKIELRSTKLKDIYFRVFE